MMSTTEQRASGVWDRLVDASSQLRQALRGLLKAPAFTLTAIGTLGLAIGVNAAIFTLVDTVLLDPLPYPDADRLVALKGSAPGTRLGEDFDLAPEFYREYQKETNFFENVASFGFNTFTLRVNDRAERIWMSNASLSLFETLRVMPELGRLPAPEDGLQVAVISHRLWQDWFGGDPNVIGRSYFAAGSMRTVVGVMPAGFEFPSEDVLLWFPSGLDALATQISPGQFGLRVIARLRSDIEPDALAARLGTIASRLPEQYGGPATYSEIIERFVPRVIPLKQELIGPLEGPLWILLGAMSILLVIAATNVANLFLVRAERQGRDVAIRRAIGAPTHALIQRQLAETMLVALLAGGLAVGVAAVMVPAIVAQGPLLAQGPLPVPRLSGTEISATTLLFAFALSVAAGLACGIIPATRVAKERLAWLRDATRSSTRRHHWARDGLVVTQAALAVLLLVGSGLLLRSFEELRSVDPGYATKDIFTFQIAPQQAQLTNAKSWSTFHHSFMERLRGMPGVDAVGIVEAFPLNEFAWSAGFSTTSPADGSPVAEQPLNLTFTAGDYFEAMGIQLLSGRTFTEAEQQLNPGYVVVAKSAAERLWPGTNPIGQQLSWNRGGVLRETVIGVVEDVRQNGLRDSTGPAVYFPLVGQRPDSWTLTSPAYVIKTSRATGIEPQVRALVRELAPEAPMYQVHTIDELVATSMAELSFTMIALALAAGLALFLGMVGLYGILSSMVAERTRELGIRIALGATPGRVRRMVVAQGLRVVTVGVVGGLIVAMLGARALESLLYGIGTFDAVTFTATSVLMLLVAAAASWIPAYRASSVDPMETLAES